MQPLSLSLILFVFSFFFGSAAGSWGQAAPGNPLPATGYWSLLDENATSPGEATAITGDVRQLFVIDGNQVRQRDSNGHWTDVTLPGSVFGSLDHPEGLCECFDFYLCVADTENHRILAGDSQEFDRNLSTEGSQPWQVESPIALAADNSGLYVSDIGNDRVQRMDFGGNWTVLTTQGGSVGEVIDPAGLAPDGMGHLYVADLDRIQLRDPQGRWSVIAPAGMGPGQVLSPLALTADGRSNLYVADRGNHRVQRRDTHGNWSILFPEGTGQVGTVIDPVGISVDYYGTVYVLDGGDGWIQEYRNFLKGDINGDGKVTVADAVLALQIAVSTIPPTFAQLQAGDLFNQGLITIVDVTQILQYAIGALPSL